MNFSRSLSGHADSITLIEQLKKFYVEQEQVKPQHIDYWNENSIMNQSDSGFNIKQREELQLQQCIYEHDMTEDNEIQGKFQKNQQEQSQNNLNPQKKIEEMKRDSASNKFTKKNRNNRNESSQKINRNSNGKFLKQQLENDNIWFKENSQKIQQNLNVSLQEYPINGYHVQQSTICQDSFQFKNNSSGIDNYKSFQKSNLEEKYQESTNQPNSIQKHHYQKILTESLSQVDDEHQISQLKKKTKTKKQDTKESEKIFKFKKKQQNLLIEDLQKIKRQVREELEQKYKTQYEILSECLTLQKKQNYIYKKKFMDLLYIIQNSKELKQEVQNFFKNNQEYFQVKNIQAFKNFQLHYQNLYFKAELKKDIEKIKQNKNQKNQGYLKNNSPYTQITLQKQITKLSSQVQFITNCYKMNQKLENISNFKQNETIFKNQQNDQSNKILIHSELGKHFPFALKYKLRAIYTYLLKILKKQTFNYSKQQKQLMKIIDSTLKQHQIVQVSFNQQNCQFLAKKFQFVNSGLQKFVKIYFESRLAKLKESFRQLILCPLNNGDIKKSQSYQHQLINQIVDFLSKAKYYNLSTSKLKQGFITLKLKNIQLIIKKSILYLIDYLFYYILFVKVLLNYLP